MGPFLGLCFLTCKLGRLGELENLNFKELLSSGTEKKNVTTEIKNPGKSGI